MALMTCTTLNLQLMMADLSHLRAPRHIGKMGNVGKVDNVKVE